MMGFRKTAAVFGVWALVFVVGACSYIEDRFQKKQENPVVQGDGQLTLYSKEGTVVLEGVAQAYFRQSAFEEGVNLVLKEVSERRISSQLPEGYTLAGPLVSIETRQGLEPLEAFELSLYSEFASGQVIYMNDTEATFLESHSIRDGEVTVMANKMGYYGIFEEAATTTAPETTTVKESETSTTTVTTTTTTTSSTATETTTLEAVPETTEVSGNDAAETPAAIIEMPHVVMIGNGSNTVFAYDLMTDTAEVFAELPISVMAETINPTSPMAVYNTNGEIGLINLLTEEMTPVLGPDELEFYHGVWSPDGNYLAMTVRHSMEDKTIVYIYSVSDHRLTALAQGNGNAMCWSGDSRTLVFSQQNFKGATESYQLVVNKASVNGDLDVIYTITVKDGEVSLANTTAADTEGQVYAVAAIRDEALGYFTLGLIYDFNGGTYEPVMTSSELYSSYMEHFHLDETLVTTYSQLGNWHLPQVTLMEENGRVFLSDGNAYYYYPEGKASGEVEITGYHSLEAVVWPDVLVETDTE